MRRHGGPRRRALLLALGLILMSAPVTPARGGFLDSINPFIDTKDAFEGRFVDTLEAWALEAAPRAPGGRACGTGRPVRHAAPDLPKDG